MTIKKHNHTYDMGNSVEVKIIPYAGVSIRDFKGGTVKCVYLAFESFQELAKLVNDYLNGDVG